MLSRFDEARAKRVPMPPVLNTPYCNSIALAEQPQFPGNLDIEALEPRILLSATWTGTAGDDAHNAGNSGDNLLSGGSGADTIHTGGGNDVVDAGRIPVWYEPDPEKYAAKVENLKENYRAMYENVEFEE